MLKPVYGSDRRGVLRAAAAGVSLSIYWIQGPLTGPGQHSGFLGAKHEP
ncbi:hypothetical protein [Allorhodopirellula heiligendammensis]|nr:hypothetical protein [Allorhodopirellula heiligendammensis]